MHSFILCILAEFNHESQMCVWTVIYLSVGEMLFADGSTVQEMILTFSYLSYICLCINVNLFTKYNFSHPIGLCWKGQSITWGHLQALWVFWQKERRDLWDRWWTVPPHRFFWLGNHCLASATWPGSRGWVGKEDRRTRGFNIKGGNRT